MNLSPLMQLIVLSLAAGAAVLIVINAIRAVRNRKADEMIDKAVQMRYVYWQRRKKHWSHKLIMRQLKREFVPTLKKHGLA
jgi:hypothetical protein